MAIDKFGILATIHNFLTALLKQEIIEFAGHRMVLDRHDSLRLSKLPIGISLEATVIRRIVKKGQIVCDIGAHIGSYTLSFAKLVGPEGKVYAFEPVPENLRLLKRNVQLNSYRNVVEIDKAVSSFSGKAKLYLSHTSSTDHQLYSSGKKRNLIWVKTTSLDDYFKLHNGKIDFVKIDVQGSEMKVFRGMQGLLKKNRHITILTEFWPEGLRLAGDSPEDYLRLLTQLGFKILEINEWEARLKKVTIDNLLKIYTVENNKDTNLLCVR